MKRKAKEEQTEKIMHDILLKYISSFYIVIIIIFVFFSFSFNGGSSLFGFNSSCYSSEKNNIEKKKKETVLNCIIIPNCLFFFVFNFGKSIVSFSHL